MIKEKKKKRKLKFIFKILVSLIILVALLISSFIIFVSFKYRSIMGDQLDKSDLEINEDLDKELNMTKKELSNIINIVVFGNDSRDLSQDDSGRSDSIMIVSLNKNLKSLKFVSIPRDTYVDIPGYGKTKINHAYSYGQEQLSIKTINKNFGLNISEYVTINFAGLINIINDVGGIEMDITQSEKDFINSRLHEAHAVSGTKIKKLEKYGKVTLTGEQALIHSRNRDIGDDFKRTERQRLVLEALLDKISTYNGLKIFSFLDDFIQQVKTNVDIKKYVLASPFLILDKDTYLKNIISKQIPALSYSENKTINGTYYFVPDIEKASDEFKEYLYQK